MEGVVVVDLVDHVCVCFCVCVCSSCFFLTLRDGARDGQGAQELEVEPPREFAHQFLIGGVHALAGIGRRDGDLVGIEGLDLQEDLPAQPTHQRPLPQIAAHHIPHLRVLWGKKRKGKFMAKAKLICV